MSARRIFARPARYAAIAPYLWMVLFFLIPFGFVVKISLSQTAIAHSTENQPQSQTVPPASGEKSKWTASGDPIDTTSFDSAVMAAEKTAGGKPSKALGDAYYKRAVALTEARQYASALGDYRRALKNDPSNAEAKDWVDKIIMIYDSMNKTSPKEGEEPPPLPFTVQVIRVGRPNLSSGPALTKSSTRTLPVFDALRSNIYA